MYKQVVIAAVLTGFASSALAAAVQPGMAGVTDPDDPRAKEAYTYQCNEWAGQATFENEQAKDAYMDNCVTDMAKVWPLGMDESE